MTTSNPTLATMHPGERGIIDAVHSTDPQILRLMVLGLVEGAEITHTSSAIGGDPMEFQLFNCSISLRQEHARFFSVSRVAAGE